MKRRQAIFIFAITGASVCVADIAFKPAKDIAANSVSGVSCIDAADIDGDGLTDVAVIEGGKHAGKRKTFAWFKAPVDTQGTWRRFEFNPKAPLRLFLGAAKLADIDTDGDPDLVVSSDHHSGDTREADVFVFVNPMPDGKSDDPWPWHAVTSNPMPYHHINDMEIADIDGDGKPDIVVRSLEPNHIHIFFQNNIGSYVHKSIDTQLPASEGLAVGHIDTDGQTDIAFTGYWLQSPAKPRTQDYVRRPIDPAYHKVNQNTKEAVGDIDRDGWLDVLIAPAEAYRKGGDHDLAWYRNPGKDWGSPWKKTVIKPRVNNHHTAKLGDIDSDGDLDVVVGVAWGDKRVQAYYNNAKGAFSDAQTIQKGKGLYSGVLADLGGDGDLDIIGQDTYANTSRPWVYESPLADAHHKRPARRIIHPRPFKPNPEQGWISLFDGKTLGGWRQVGYGHWSVEDGVLIGRRQAVENIRNPGGFLFTDRADFRDFELILAVKAGWGTDTGIHLRDVSDGFTQSGDGYQCCLDYRIGAHAGGQYGVFYYKAKNENYAYWMETWPYRIQNPFEAMENPRFDAKHNRKWIAIEDWPRIFNAHGWNQIKVRLTGEPPTYECWINGVKTVEYRCKKSWNAGTGRIGLQIINDPNWIVGGLIRFRNIFVKVLPDVAEKG